MMTSEPEIFDYIATVSAVFALPMVCRPSEAFQTLQGLRLLVSDVEEWRCALAIEP